MAADGTSVGTPVYDRSSWDARFPPRIVREATARSVVAGPGVRSDNLDAIFEFADAALVGSSLKEGEVWHGPMSKETVLELARARDRIAGAGDL